MIFEVCIDSVEGALAAQTGGAQRVELCDNLVEGGTTPSLGMIRVARQMIQIDLHVLVRPRGGDFVYSELEFQVMCADIQICKQAGVNGVVLGILRPDGHVDAVRTRKLIELARPMRITFHRAFDVCRDPTEALQTLMELGIERVLTSGRKASALEGAENIAQYVKQSQGRIAILAGGGVTAANLPQLVAETSVNEVHFSAREEVESPMQFRNLEAQMGKPYQPDEYHRKVTTVERVRQVIRSVKRNN